MKISGLKAKLSKSLSSSSSQPSSPFDPASSEHNSVFRSPCPPMTQKTPFITATLCPFLAFPSLPASCHCFADSILEYYQYVFLHLTRYNEFHDFVRVSVSTFILVTAEQPERISVRYHCEPTVNGINSIFLVSMKVHDNCYKW